MSNYRRLISYIYAYEGGVKGKNIGFAKLEARNGQCKINVNVKKVYVGGSDIGVYLLAEKKEIFIGKIFVRNGMGEFRTSVQTANVENTNCTLDECYGLTVHEIEDAWLKYTTIWEDAVAHAAEIELSDVTSESRKEAEPRTKSPSAAENIIMEPIRSIAREIEQELAADNQLSGAEPSENEKTIQPNNGWLEPGNNSLFNRMNGRPGSIIESCMYLVNQMRPDTAKTEGLFQAAEIFASGNSCQDELPHQTATKNGGHQRNSVPPLPVISAPGQEQSQGTERVPGNMPLPETVPLPANMPSQGSSASPVITPLQGSVPLPGAEPVPGTEPFQLPETEQLPKAVPLPDVNPSLTGMMPPMTEILQSEPAQENMLRPEFTVKPEHPSIPDQQSSPEPEPQPEITMPPGQGTQAPSPVICKGDEKPIILGNPQDLENLDMEEDRAADQRSIWDFMRKTHAKIQAFDYENGCEILTIKPQDIGLLPRETWVFGNNSFLLHGYYNYRYIILVKLNNTDGSCRYLLGVPGNYYSNEKYMASMFGFPNFVLAKKQMTDDGRFGFWYTDIRLGD